jgi:hypothetical protein
MATFKFGRDIDIHWNGYDIQGPADTVFSIPDQLYEEFDADISPIEPTLVWLDTNEFLTLQNNVSVSTLSATFPIALSTSTSGKTISLSSSTNPNGYLLAADGSGGIIFTPASTSGLTSVVGASPISSTIAGGTATVSIDQSAITGAAAATNAQTVRTYVKNTTGTTIPLGSAVYVSGATGDNALIALSTASTEVGSSKTLGITAESIANDAFGYVVESGYLTGINTTGISAGTSVWLGNTPGALVFGAPPAEPSHSVYLGVVIREQQNNGSILVKVQNGYELDELHDVSAGSPTDLDILQYKSSSSLWTKASIANAGIAASSHTHAQIDITNLSTDLATINTAVTSAQTTATNAIPKSTVTTKGDIIVASAASSVQRLGIGSDGQILTARSTATNGVAWEAISGSGYTVEQLTGTGTWTRPSGVQFIDVTIIGAGGGGAGGSLAYSHGVVNGIAPGGGGGGSGKFYYVNRVYVGGSSTFSYSVGAGGAGGAARTYVQGAGVTKTSQALAGNAGATGGTTTFGSLISVTGSSGGGGGTPVNSTTGAVAGLGAGVTTLNVGLTYFPSLAKGTSTGGDSGTSSSGSTPSSGTSGSSDWYINGILDTGNEVLPPSFGIFPTNSLDSFVSISSTSATISTNQGTATYALGIGSSTDSAENLGDGPTGGAGGGGSSATSTTRTAGNGALSQSPSGPGGGGAAIYISASTATVTMSASAGANAGGSWGMGGGGGGGGCTATTSSTSVSNGCAVTLSSGAGGNGSTAIMYIGYNL